VITKSTTAQIEIIHLDLEIILPANNGMHFSQNQKFQTLDFFLFNYKNLISPPNEYILI